eukprot:TRINITY_DN1742_c0_g2_i1.p2 TRINITY_DN1742_c0_g2~~TRINITY_DN1742_c0_g2_i1.p2  ORF type:complete len:145 (+),score=31.76 TRINITY_DN1742_c0_g2_i1:533-967(+)
MDYFKPLSRAKESGSCTEDLVPGSGTKYYNKQYNMTFCVDVVNNKPLSIESFMPSDFDSYVEKIVFMAWDPTPPKESVFEQPDNSRVRVDEISRIRALQNPAVGSGTPTGTASPYQPATVVQRGGSPTLCPLRAIIVCCPVVGG